MNSRYLTDIINIRNFIKGDQRLNQYVTYRDNDFLDAYNRKMFHIFFAKNKTINIFSAQNHIEHCKKFEFHRNPYPKFKEAIDYMPYAMNV